jgi:hypothetical protein
MSDRPYFVKLTSDNEPIRINFNNVLGYRVEEDGDTKISYIFPEGEFDYVDQTVSEIDEILKNVHMI